MLSLLTGVPALAPAQELEDLVAPQEETFLEQLKRIDTAIKKNPNRVSQLVLESCLQRRKYALELYNDAQVERAQRNLTYCFDTLGIPKHPPRPKRPDPSQTIAEVQAAAAQELEKALALKPDTKRGLAIYRDCALCHEPEGFGLPGGSVPQIAGQHRTVVIKQLADIRAGNRDANAMLPYASVKAIGGVQAVADVAGYIDTLEISTAGGKGTGKDLEHGAAVYDGICANCHGENGEGNAEAFVPRIQSQHYRYLLREFEWIRTGKRRNAHMEMQAQIQDLSDRDVEAVLDYVSRLEPPEEYQAPPGWRNPDFAAP